MAGAIVFDGVTIDVSARTDGKQLARFRIAEVLFGEDLLSSPIVTLITPAAENGGIAFRSGWSYRVFTVPLRGNFYTWDATGSFPYAQRAACPA
jgi:hypothetical protein